jgi:flagellar hook assembly protein FlgD
MVSSCPGRIDLEVYNLGGKKIHSIAQHYNASASHEFSWDGKLNGNGFCPAGVYILRVMANGQKVGSYPFTFLAQ